MLQEGKDGSRKRFHVSESKIFSERSASEECLGFDDRRVNKVIIDHDNQDEDNLCGRGASDHYLRYFWTW